MQPPAQLPEKLEARFDLSYYQLVLANIAVLDKPLRVGYLFLGPVSAALLAWGYMFREHMFTLFGICGLFLLVAQPLRAWTSYNKSLDKMRDVTITMTPELVINRANVAESEGRHRWTSVWKVTKQFGMIMIFIRRRPPIAVCIPRKAFQSDQQAEQFYAAATRFWRQAQADKHALGLCHSTQQNERLSPQAMRYIAAAAVIASLGLWSGHFSTTGFVLLIVFMMWVTRRYKANNLLLSANAAVNTGRFEQACKYASDAILADPKFISSYVTASTAMFRMKQVQQGIDLCSHALTVDSQSAEVFSNRAYGYVELGDYEHAREDVVKAIDLNPGLQQARLIYAFVELESLNLEEAERQANEAVVLNSKSYGAFMCRALVRIAMCRQAEALQDAEKAVELCRKIHKIDYSDAFYTRASAHVFSRHPDQAITDATRAIECDPQSAGSFIVRAYAFLHKQAPELAILDLDAAESLTQKKRLIAYSKAIRARAEVLAGNLVDARRYAEEAVQLNPKPTPLGTLAMVMTRMGEAAQAVEVLNRAVTMSPYYGEGFWFRHAAYQALGRDDLAIEDKAHALNIGYIPGP